MPVRQHRWVQTVDLVFLRAGGGHRAAALALRELVQRQGRPWRVRLVDLAEVLDPGQRLRRMTGIDPEALYNRRLQRGWTLGLGQELKLLQRLLRAAHPSMLRTLSAHWVPTRPDLVVSLVPNFNRALGESLQAARPGTPFVTVMTDMADLPPNFWIEPGIDQWLVCGTERAVEQACRAGVPPGRTVQASGMVLRPTFYELGSESREAQRRDVGLDALAPTAVVMDGGQGSRQMLRIARALPNTPMVLMCGHNTALADELRQLRRPAPHAVFGFTDDVAGVMRLGDFFIGKPGPGCLSEAVHLGLPVITFRNAWTMPQERFNTEWVLSQGVGLVISSLAGLPAAVEQMTSQLCRFHAAAARLDNCAVFEVVDLLHERLRQAVGAEMAVGSAATAVAA